MHPAQPCRTITHVLTLAMDGDTIAVAAGTYDTALGETFPLVINQNLTLTGAGAGSTTIDATGANATVIVVIFGKTVMISGVTVTGGGNRGILNEGTLTLTNSTVSGNTASCDGDECLALGGGIDNEFGGTLTLTKSTVSGNTARCEGPCGAFGGGIVSGDTFTPANTIIAKNHSGGDCSNFGTITSNGFNLDSDNSCNLNVGLGDLPGLDPLLGPLQNNGGPTETHALLPGSPAIDAVTSGCQPPRDGPARRLPPPGHPLRHRSIRTSPIDSSEGNPDLQRGPGFALVVLLVRAWTYAIAIPKTNADLPALSGVACEPRHRCPSYCPLFESPGRR